MNIEELKDAIRDTFSDDQGDSFVWAYRRLGFLLAELGHGWVNVIKEFMRDKLKWSEAVSDVAKYPVAWSPILLIGLLFI